MSVTSSWVSRGFFLAAALLFALVSVRGNAQQTVYLQTPSSATYGSSVTFNVTISPTMSGTIGLYVDGSEVSSHSFGGTSTSFAVSTLAAGSHSAYAQVMSGPRSSTVSFSVWPAQLTVTASSLASNYGASPPALTMYYSSFVNGDTASVLSGAPALTTAATASSPAGTYPITVSRGTLAAANYGFVFVNGTLTVNKAFITMTANAASSTYGTTPGPFSASFSGFVNSDTVAVVSGAPSLTTTATSSSPVGSYTISAGDGTLAASNYSIMPRDGTLTITQANTVTSVNSNANPSTYGQSVAYSALINTEGGTRRAASHSETAARLWGLRFQPS